MIRAVIAGTIIDSLDRHAGAWTAILTFVLVVVTAFYALKTFDMAREMKRARDATILPKLALDFHRLGPTTMTLLVQNVGPGAALEVDVRAVWEPLADGDAVERRWRRNTLASGDQADFMPPGDLNDNLNSLPKTYRSVRLVGVMKDAAGTEHKVDDLFDDLAEWREILGKANQRWVKPTS